MGPVFVVSLLEMLKHLCASLTLWLCVTVCDMGIESGYAHLLNTCICVYRYACVSSHTAHK